MRNYEAALQKAGFTTVFSCAKASCGAGDDFGSMMLERVGNNFIQGSSDYWAPFNYSRESNRYLLARGTRADGSVVHAAVYVVDPDNQHNGGVLVELVEGKAMETNKVSASLDASAMAKSIATDGKVAVYGVTFDTDKADIQPKSKAALDEMAKLMAADPKLKVYIVGHTDSVGDFAHNVDLSQRRAEAVARMLATSYKVDAKRLMPRGVASLAPVASNDAEAGREKNRRVELVKQ
jgi:outer membrane protein OmpA-like peptidoglycan-associated protein